MDNNRKVKIGVFVLLVCIIIYDIVNRYQKRSAMRNAQQTEATIIAINPSKNIATIQVKYLVHNIFVESEFGVAVDTFKIGDKLILNVTNEPPYKYFDYIKKKSTAENDKISK